MANINLKDNPVSIGVVLFVAGYVVIKGLDGLLKTLSPGDVVNSGDQIETGKDGELTIGFVDGTSLELGAGGTALLDSEVFDTSSLNNSSGFSALTSIMQNALRDGGSPYDALQAAEESFQTLNEGGSLPDFGGQQPIGGDVETHTMPEMVLPKISISSISILEPSPGKSEDEHGSDSGHDSGHDTGSDSGHDSGHDTGSDSGHDTGSDSGHDTGSDSGHDSGGGHSAGQGGGYGYAGGSLSSVAVFTVTLSSAATRDVRVDFRTVDGTAISGGNGVSEADYGATSGTLVIPEGQSSGTIEVTIYSDKLVEAGEQFYVTLSNPVNGIIDNGTAIGNIIDSGHGHGEEGEPEVVTGTSGDDVLITKGGPDIINGLEGNDTLISGGGPDIIHGGEGDDLIVGLGGPDELYGDAGNDEIVGHGGKDLIDGGEGDDIIYAGGAPDNVTGGSGDDFINAEGGPDIVSGGEGNDTIYGGGGPDTLSGDAGNDVIRGEGGPDVLLGGTGNDELYGGGGPDLLNGGEGADTLKGGGAGDVFKFDNLDGEVDRILDFDQHDQIDISAILDMNEGDALSDYIQITPHATDEFSYELSVNTAGTGSINGYEPLLVMENMQTEPDIDQLVNNGNLIVIE